MNRRLWSSLFATLLYTSCAFSLTACNKEPAPADPSPSKSSGTHEGDGHAHAPGESHDHGHDHEDGQAEGDGHAHGDATPLGDAVVGEFTIIAAQEGKPTPGGDVGIDVTIVGPADGYTAIRVWVGVESGEGSVKARADRAGEAWHAHAEVPSPIPADSMIWVELELKSGDKLSHGFAIK